MNYALKRITKVVRSVLFSRIFLIFQEMAEMRRGLNEKEDEAEEQRRVEETEAIKNLQDQVRQQQEQNRLETDKYLRQIDELRETLSANEVRQSKPTRCYSISITRRRANYS